MEPTTEAASPKFVARPDNVVKSSRSVFDYAEEKETQAAISAKEPVRSPTFTTSPTTSVRSPAADFAVRKEPRVFTPSYMTKPSSPATSAPAPATTSFNKRGRSSTSPAPWSSTPSSSSSSTTPVKYVPRPTNVVRSNDKSVLDFAEMKENPYGVPVRSSSVGTYPDGAAAAEGQEQRDSAYVDTSRPTNVVRSSGGVLDFAEKKENMEQRDRSASVDTSRSTNVVRSSGGSVFDYAERKENPEAAKAYEQRQRQMAGSVVPPPQVSGECQGCGRQGRHDDELIPIGVEKWHTGCVFCVKCKRPTLSNFVALGGIIYCSRCVPNTKSVDIAFPNRVGGGPTADGTKLCGGCGEAIDKKDYDTVLIHGNDWHERCFVCGVCKEGFPDGTYYFDETGSLLCAKHSANIRGGRK